MHDSYGDGWQGATVQVLVNNTVVGTFSAAGRGSTANFSICTGDSLKLVYSAGTYENENSYELQDSSWSIVFRDGPTPQTGMVFSTVGNCNTPLLPGSVPCTAIPIDTGQCVYADNTGFPNSGVTATCANFQGRDMWFSVQVPPSGNLLIETDSGTINDTGMNIWRATACNSNLQSIACDDDSGIGYFSRILLNDLNPGETIYIQMYGYGGAQGGFRLCVDDVPPIRLDSTELPLVMINTLGQTIVNNGKVNCQMEVKYNGPGRRTFINDIPNIYDGQIGISVRGASSSGYPQQPFSVETRNIDGTNRNTILLGMPSENDWVLQSNFNDRSLVKNLLGPKLFGEMGNYTVKNQLCEVLIDSSYRGIYVIGEKIKRDRNRVNIATLNPADTLGDALTGGYILQQTYWDASNSFQSNFSPIDHPGLTVAFVYEYPEPTAINAPQKRYIASFVDSLETALYSSNFSDPSTGYRKYMDTKSFIDYFLVNELSRNADGFKKSVFFHKNKNSRGGKLKAGPVWDFDWAWKNIGGICSIYEGYAGAGWAHKNNDCFHDNTSTGWYVRMLQDSTFRDELRCTYEDYRQDILDTVRIFNYIDSIGRLVVNAQARHFKKWPILGVSGPAPDYGPVATTYYGELDSLKKWIGIRVRWLDANIPGLCSLSGVDETDFSDEVKCFPNPANDYLTIEYDLPAEMEVTARLYNYLGSEVLTSQQGFSGQGKHSIRLETANLSAGIYILKLERGNDVVSKKILIMK